MWSNEFINIPFAEKGRSREGCDCWGLAKVIYEESLNIRLPMLLDYENVEDFDSIAGLVTENRFSDDWIPVERGEEQAYDVLLFKRMGAVIHVGIVVRKGLMLHCDRGSSTTHVEYLKDANWSKRLKGIYRHAEHSDRGITV